jgi:hypothetical protein
VILDPLTEAKVRRLVVHPFPYGKFPLGEVRIMNEEVERFEREHGITKDNGIEKIRSAENQQTQQQEKSAITKQTEKTQEEAEHFIRNLTVTYSSAASVILKPEGKSSKEFPCTDMGFKATAKTWMMFIDVLQKGDHKFHVGIYSKDKDHIKNKNYNSLAKLPSNFSKKFVSFLNEEYSASLPEGFNVFQNMKGSDRAGIYKPKFPIGDKYDVINSTEIKKMSNDETINKLEELSKQLKDEKNNSKKDIILIEIREYAEHAKKNGWITEGYLRGLISLPTEEASESDAMSITDFHKNTKIFHK